MLQAEKKSTRSIPLLYASWRKDGNLITALVDNNVYTNLMAQHNLRSAAEAAKRHPHVARALGVHAGEIASWSETAEKMFIPYDKNLNVTVP